MGSAYINDFDFNNRSYRVYVQADQQFRAQSNDIKQFYVRSDTWVDDPPGKSGRRSPRPRRPR